MKLFDKKEFSNLPTESSGSKQRIKRLGTYKTNFFYMNPVAIWLSWASLSPSSSIWLMFYDMINREKSDSNKHVIAIIVCWRLLLLLPPLHRQPKPKWKSELGDDYGELKWSLRQPLPVTLIPVTSSHRSGKLRNKFLIYERFSTKDFSKCCAHNVIDYKI